jgi:carbohydrate-selective porin OprB
LDDYVTFRVGKQDMNTEFQCINASENFVQSTFGLSPSTAFPTYPAQALGVVTLVQLVESTRLKFGAWSAFARAGSWGHSGSDSFLVVGELERTFALVEGRLPGIVAIGALYESDGELEDQSVSAVREYYIQFEQMLYQEKPWESDDNQGLMLFAGYYPRFPGEEVLRESIGDSAVVGLTYTGLVNGRDDDMLGLGLSWAELYQGGTNEETATEVFYRAPLSPRMIVQPDLQYISSPSGIYRDALVAGFRFEVRPR